MCLCQDINMSTSSILSGHLFKSVHQDHVTAVIKCLPSHHRFCSLLQVSAHYCHVNKVCSCLSYQISLIIFVISTQSAYVCHINIVCSSHQGLLLSCPIQRRIQAFTAQLKLLSSFHSWPKESEKEKKKFHKDFGCHRP